MSGVLDISSSVEERISWNVGQEPKGLFWTSRAKACQVQHTLFCWNITRHVCKAWHDRLLCPTGNRAQSCNVLSKLLGLLCSCLHRSRHHMHSRAIAEQKEHDRMACPQKRICLICLMCKSQLMPCAERCGCKQSMRIPDECAGPSQSEMDWLSGQALNFCHVCKNVSSLLACTCCTTWSTNCRAG